MRYNKWKALPPELSTSILIEAMKVLEQFSEQEESYLNYLSRQQAQMKERSMKEELDMANAALKKAEAENAELLKKIAKLEATKG